MKANPNLYATLIRIQAKIRGLLIRGKVKSMRGKHDQMMPYHNPDSQYHVLTVAKIVLLYFIN